ncbi:hypothetical protein RHGRI_031132 [Rhododendron griersonianum]|uniref:RRM domain-containing protein n=1 Tax=Rhododendron griersonianum TaxID=479676 RepID=A0AAV6IAH3_9ERIC|nr:hypothetical protein RHGRI_031132 [Rhododendron griersonianum]
MFILFVDNIPEAKDQVWLRSTFNKFGVVKDAFIPSKRRKRTGNKFGFVRFDCHVSAGMAMTKMNGVWVDNNRLFVKEACFGHNKAKIHLKLPKFATEQVLKQRSYGRKEINGLDYDRATRGMFGPAKSYVHALEGESSKKPIADQSITILVNSIGNGGLYRSAVAVMHKVVSMSTLKSNFSLESDTETLFRTMGGRSVLITFQSQEARDLLIKDPWMNLWFDEVKPWNGEPASFERFVWLKCQGIPLNAWNAQTFKQIGEVWGYFIAMDEATLKDFSFAKGMVLIATEEKQKIDRWIKLVVQGVIYEVKVTEESSFVNPEEVELCTGKVKKPPMESRPETHFREGMEGDDDVEAYSNPAANRIGGLGGSVAGIAGVLGTDKVHDGIIGSQLKIADMHLMPELSSTQAPSGDFESVVEDSVEALERGVIELGVVGQNVVTPLAHEEAHLANTTPQIVGGPVVPFNVKGSLGLQALGSTEVIDDSPSPRFENKVHPDVSPVASGGYSEEPAPLVRSSHIPSINLLVDLNDVECRRRRRRQLSNLAIIREGMEEDRTRVENSVSSSAVSPQSSSRVIREVRATMEIGGELGINFRPDDDLVLRSMIEIESLEYSQMLEREAEG